MYLAQFNTEGLEDYLDHYPFIAGEVVLCLGEIENMPGHVAVVKKDGRVLYGYHPENFSRMKDESLCTTFETSIDDIEDLSEENVVG